MGIRDRPISPRPAPEDCGGIPSFYASLEAVADPTHEGHAEAKEWADEYDPNAVDELMLQYPHRFLRWVLRVFQPLPPHADGRFDKVVLPPSCSIIQERVRAGLCGLWGILKL
jgi:Plasmid pRiA4b ORF-3-like protein